jgi:type IV pilus assembly protein PilM
MAPALMDLITEIRRSFEYYSSKYQGQPDKLVLCGGTAKLKDLSKLIENELGIPVELANPLHNVTVFSRQLSEGYLDEIASVLPVSVGLAIRDMIGE